MKGPTAGGETAAEPPGPQGSGWGGAPDTHKQACGTSPSANPPKSSRTSLVQGEVRGFQNRNETREPGHRTQIVWTFRVERYDAGGNRQPPVPVEMRSRSFEGFINEGDRVELPGYYREGQLVRPRKLRNVTTGAMVRARSPVDWKIIPKTIVVLALCIILIILAKFLSDTFRSSRTPRFDRSPKGRSVYRGLPERHYSTFHSMLGPTHGLKRAQSLLKQSHEHHMFTRHL
jgi:hypothetical protein